MSSLFIMLYIYLACFLSLNVAAAIAGSQDETGDNQLSGLSSSIEEFESHTPSTQAPDIQSPDIQALNIQATDANKYVSDTQGHDCPLTPDLDGEVEPIQKREKKNWCRRRQQGVQQSGKSPRTRPATDDPKIICPDPYYPYLVSCGGKAFYLWDSPDLPQRILLDLPLIYVSVQACDLGKTSYF